MCRSPCCSIEGLNRGSWTKKEDIILSEYIRVHGDGGWTNLPQRAGLRRCGKSCRLRWLNYLRPDIKRGNISPYEEDLIVRLHRLLGNRWSLIAGRLPGRTDNEIKNYWNTRLSKKLLSMNKTQPKSSEENLKRTSKYSSCSQNYLYEPIPVKTTTAVRQSELLRPNGCSDIHSSDKAFHFSNIRETMNSSKSRCDLLVNDSVTEDDSEPMSFGIADVNLVETEATNSACSMSNSAYQQLLHSDYFPGHAGTFDESLFDLSKLSSPLCNVLSSQSYFSTDSGSEDFYSGLATLGAEMNVYEYMCSYQSNVQYVNNFALPDDQELKNSTIAQIP